MSGISISTKQRYSLFAMLVLLLNFSSLSATEQSVKVTASQGSVSKQSTDEKFVKTDSTSFKSQLQSERSARYKDVSDPLLSLETIAEKTTAPKKVTKTRDASVTTQLKSSHFYISSADVYMVNDQDGDGYYSEFSVKFDADTSYNSATVYAYLYLSLNGGPWELYYSTEYFNLNGSSYYDDYTVRTLLTNGFPSGSYDILIDLYDEYDDSLVATISSDDTYNLAEHYLEDVSYDKSTNGYSLFSIYDAGISLLRDNDNDGFYQSFSLQFDADVDTGSALIYAEIWIEDSRGEWQLDHSTEDFQIDGYSTLDTYILETTLESGYTTGYYNFRIELYDAITDAFLASSSDLAYQLSGVPLEDVASDYKSDVVGDVVSDNYPDSISHGSGGAGSTEVLMMLLMLMLLFNQKQTKKALVNERLYYNETTLNQ